MQWWAWIAVGAILLGSELTFVDAQFYLVFLGVSALVVGVLGAAGLTSAPLQWLLFGVLAVLSMFTFRRQVYQRLRRTLPAMKAGPAGELVTLDTTLGPGETCRVEHRGSTWNAVNGGGSVIEAGAKARIVSVDRLTLVIRDD
jgi:membrane protein implicated in regulation of membrane protease activity